MESGNWWGGWGLLVNSAGGVGMALRAVCCLQCGKDEWKRPRDRDKEGFLPAGKSDSWRQARTRGQPLSFSKRAPAW